MKKYKLVKKIDGIREEIGHVFEENRNHGIEYRSYDGTHVMENIIIALLVHAGFLEEVVESKEWEPKEGDQYWFISSDGVGYSNWYIYDFEEKRRSIFGVYKNLEEAQEMLSYLVEKRKEKQLEDNK